MEARIVILRDIRETADPPGPARRAALNRFVEGRFP